MITFLLGLIIGITLASLYDSKYLERLNKRYKWFRRSLLILTAPFAFLVLLPIDYYERGTTFKRYVETYKSVW